jgi:acetyl-CoA carboxylase biotin carboxyl carrier protein
MIDLGFLEKLLDLLHRSDAHTIEVRKWTTTIRISKGGFDHAAGPVTYQVAAPASSAPSGNSAAPAAAAASAAPPAAGGGEAAGGRGGGSHLTEIKSPMVGTYYAQPEPGADPYVRVGTRIKPGQTLCIIEAMKIMNPLDSEVSGLVEEVLAEDAQPVEFGQVLFRVNPNG